MEKKIDEATRKRIYEDLERGVKYEEIKQKYGIGLATINRIKRKYKTREVLEHYRKKDKDKTNKKKQIEDDVLRVAVASEMVKRSEFFVNGIIDVLNIIKYSVTNLIQINERAEQKTDEYANKLNEIKEILEKSQGEADALTLRMINRAMEELTRFVSIQKLRIDAINGIKEQMKMFLDYELTAKMLTEVRALVDDFFVTLNVLSDSEYAKFREAMIKRNFVSKHLFEKFETGEPEQEVKND